MNYVYSAQTKATPKVLDTLVPGYLANTLPALSGMVPSYSNPNNPGDFTDLYYSTSNTTHPGHAILNTILNESKSNLNNALFLPLNSNVMQASSNTGSLKIYRCKDGLYVYQYFKNDNLQLYNLYLRVPKLVYKNRHPYQADSEVHRVGPQRQRK